MYKRFTYTNKMHYNSARGFVLALVIFCGMYTHAQKSYVPGAITGIPGSLSPSNARILVGDFDGDGDVDMLYQNSNTPGSSIHYLKNNGNSTFSNFDANASGTFGAGTPFNGITFTLIVDPDKATTGQTIGQRVFDYDGDGDMDILQMGTTAGQARILLQSGGTFTVGTLSAAFPASLTSSVSRWVTADFDSDGDDDILYQSGNVSGAGIHFLRNDHNGNWVDFAANASGTFSTGPLSGLTFTKIGNTADIYQFVFDADGDGDKDLYELSAGSSRYFARNGATFIAATLPTGLPTGLSPAIFRIVPGDFDKDKDIDFLYQTSNVSGANINYVRNNHNGTFTAVAAVGGQFSGPVSPFGFATFTFISRAANNQEMIILDIDADTDLDIYQLGNTSASVLLQIGNNLPIKLEYFTVNKRGSQVQVNWKTSEEINLDYFSVEYSLDAINFKDLQDTKGKGGTIGAEYSYLHTNPVRGLQYYRLVETDLDGTKTFFPIKSILFDGLKKPVEVYPTEVVDRVTAFFNKSQFNKVQLMDQMGRILLVKDITQQQAEVSISMLGYTHGIYYLRFIGNDNAVTERVVKR